MRLSLLLSLCLLVVCGCAARRGEILGTSPLGYRDTAFIEIGEDEYFWIAPPVSGPHGVPPAQMQIPKSGLWVLEGWFIVESQCFTPKDRPDVHDPILPETEDQQPLYVVPVTATCSSAAPPRSENSSCRTRAQSLPVERLNAPNQAAPDTPGVYLPA